VGIKLPIEDFKKNILRRYCVGTEIKAINRRGFLQFIKDSIKEHGENVVWRWFEKWGYDKEMYSQEARCFMLSIHSMKPIAL
jgi:hypothetical protein